MRVLYPSLTYMLAEELQRPIPSERSRFGIVRATLVAIETMPGIRVNASFGLGPCLANSFNIRHRNVIVFLAEMQHERDTRLLVSELSNGAAVITNRCPKVVESRRADKGDRAAVAKSQ